MSHTKLPLQVAIFTVALAFAPLAAEARPIAFTGTLTIDIFWPFPPFHFAATGSGVADVTVADGVRAGLELPASAFMATTSKPLTGTSIAPIRGQAIQFYNDTGSFVRPPATGEAPTFLGGVMPLRGVARICLFFACGSTQGPAIVSLPLSNVGLGGTVTEPTGPILFTLLGAPWTSGAILLPGRGFLTGSSTPSALSLVTPIFISTNVGVAPFVNGYGRLDLVFAEAIPEPHTLALVMVGLLGIGVRRSGRAVGVVPRARREH